MLEPTAQIGCKPVDYGSIESVSGLQSSEDRTVVNAIEGCRQVDERQHREVARVQCGENIGGHFQNRGLGRVISPVCGLKGRKQVIAAEIFHKLEIGRYERTSAGSMSAFLSSGVT